MRRLIVWLTILLVLSLTGTGFAALAITAQAQGYPPCTPASGVTCPAGDMGWYLVTVQETPPLPGIFITCTAAGPFSFRPGQNPQTQAQNANGIVTFTFINMGGCGNITFTATSPASPPAGPTPPIYNASPDANGDCTVTLTDFIFFAQCYLGTIACCDYNCDGIVNLVDFITFAGHYLHVC